MASPHPGKFSHGGLPQRRGNSFQQVPLALGKKSKTNHARNLVDTFWTPLHVFWTPLGSLLNPWTPLWPKNCQKGLGINMCNDSSTRRTPKLLFQGPNFEPDGESFDDFEFIFAVCILIFFVAIQFAHCF